jgi:hypothetical protein
MIRWFRVLFCLGILVLALPACGPGGDGDASSADVSGGGETVTPVESFSMSSAQQTAPEDVLREIAFYGAGGGAGVCDVVGICDQSYQAPTVVALSEQVGLGDPMGIVACGWQPGERVRATVRLPGGEEFARDVQAVEELGTYYACFEYSAAPDDPLGSYTFILEGESGTVQGSVQVTEPLSPRLKRDGDRLLLWAFEPGERVRLLAYERAGYEPGVLLDEVGVLAGWQEYRVDAGGRLAIQVEGDYAYAIVGDVSGEVLPYKGISYRGVLSFSVEADTGSEPLDVREGPGRDHRVVSQVASGTRMRVNAQPRHFAGDTWLPVRLDDGSEGWVLEGDVRVVTEP